MAEVGPPASGRAVPAPRPRGLLALACALGAGALAWWMPALRGAEAAGAARLVGPATGTTTSIDLARATLYWDLGRPSVHGLTVTPECSVVPFAMVLLLVSAALAPSGRVPAGRIVVGCIVAIAMAVVLNTVRLTGIAWAVHAFGPRTGLWWSHTVLGSLVTVLGVLVALATYVGLAFGGRSAPARSTSPRPHGSSPNQKAS